MSNQGFRISIFMVMLMLMVPLSTLVTEGTHKTALEEESTANLSSASSSTPEQLGWGNQTTFSGSSTDDATQVLALENHSVIITRKSSTTLSNGTTSNTNGSSTVLVLIYDHALNNTLVKHYHFGGTSSASNSEVYGIAKNPLGGFAISGCYWGGAAYIGNHRFSSYGNNGACFQGFLVSFDSSFEIDFAKEMNADGSNIAWDNTWANLAIDDSGNIYMSGGYNRCNSATCLYFFDTDNSGNVKKTPSVSSYCGPSSGTFKSYIYVAK